VATEEEEGNAAMGEEHYRGGFFELWLAIALQAGFQRTYIPFRNPRTGEWTIEGIATMSRYQYAAQAIPLWCNVSYPLRLVHDGRSTTSRSRSRMRPA
jgi:hypothetical protein